MGFRFRRSIKIAPGLRVNFNRKSTSVRIGPRGLGYTINSNGQKRVSAGIPGTGISYSEVVSPKRQRQTYEAVPLVEAEPQSTSKGPVVLLIIAVLLGVGWCSNRNATAPSSSASNVRAVQQKTEAPVSPPSVQIQDRAIAPVTPAENVSIAPRTVMPATPAPTTLYTTAGVRLRAEPSTGSRIILTVPLGSAVKSMKTEGLWHHVSYGNYIGWIRGDYLATRRPAQQRTAQPTAVPLVSAPPRARSSNSGRYIRGPRGGCYYINSSGNKTYVDRSRCG